MVTEHTSTRELLERWRGGDRRALDVLLEQDLPWIRERVHRRLGALLRRKGETEDYVQEAMVHVLRYGPRFVVSDRDQFRALIARIVENVLRDQSDYHTARRRAVEKERPLPSGSVVDLDPAAAETVTPSRQVIEDERQARVRVGLELLDREDREVILLREFDGLPFGRIGERLQVSEDAARQRFNRALPRLAEVLMELERGRLGRTLEGSGAAVD
jgi:RNA polymerase sigma-70 factor (ECF subfamily)